MKKILCLLLLLTFFSIACERVYPTKEGASEAPVKSEQAENKEVSLPNILNQEEKTDADELAIIKERGFVRIGVPSDKPPFGYMDENGAHQGFNPYIAKQFAKDLFGDESKIEYVLVEAATREKALDSGTVDIVLANYTVTEQRKELVDFAYPYMKTALAVVSPKNSPITNMEELDGKKVLVNENTVADIYFTNNFPKVDLIRVEYTSQAYEALKNGEADAIAHDNSLLFSWAHNNPEFVVGIQSIGETEYIAPAVRKGNKVLLDWVNLEMKKLGNENFFHQAYDATLRPAYGSDIDPDDVVIEAK